MIIIRVQGGLGNQLYQYAMYEKLKTFGKEVKLDTYYYSGIGKDQDKRPLELDKFPGIHYEACTPKEHWHYIDDKENFLGKVRRRIFGVRQSSGVVKETEPNMPRIFMMDKGYIDGFWNCEAYYSDITELLQKKILGGCGILKESSHGELSETEQKNRKCLMDMKNQNAVSIHVRRGDYLLPKNEILFGDIATREYYQSAVTYIKKHVENPFFYIFSDDIEYAERLFGTNRACVVDWNTGENSYLDMILMSQCTHNICANSTFSMWGARLNSHPNKIMIRPLRHDNHDVTKPELIKQWWSEWILLDRDGKII